MDDQDYKLEDVGSLAQKVGQSEWPFWKKIIIFLSIAVFLIILFIIIIVLANSSSSKKTSDEEKKREEEEKKQEEEEGIDESKVYGDIICQYEIDGTSTQTTILGKEFIKPNNFDILVDNKKIGFFREYKFSKTGMHTLRFIFYDYEVNLDNMFKGIKSLISAELLSEHNLTITSMQSTFEDCSNLNKFNLTGYDLTKVTNVQKLFFGANDLKDIDLELFANSNLEDMSYFFAMSDISTLDFSKLNTKNVKNMSHIFYGCGSLSNLDLSPGLLTCGWLRS